MSPRCPACCFDNHVENAGFCQYCGAALINFCSSDDCLHDDEVVVVPLDARYCPYCGSETTFKVEGYFDEEDNLDNE